MYLLPLKVPHREIEFELYLCFFIYSFIHSLIHIFFTIIYLFHFISFTLTKYDISVLKSFNNSPACIYFHSKCLTARLSFELYLCLFIYSFIHLFVFFFYYYLFVSLNLIYINQVWHFCFEIVQNTRPFTSTQSASPQLRTLNWFI